MRRLKPALAVVLALLVCAAYLAYVVSMPLWVDPGWKILCP